MFARHFIDSLDFARNGMELRGEVAMAEMPRLQDMLAEPEGQVSYVLRGRRDKNGKPVLELTLEGSCQLRCQRCLQSLAYPINMTSRLLPVPEGELDDSSPEEDGMDRIPAQASMNVLDLVEEEILLGLPLAPKHEFGACDAATESSPIPSRKPFEVLGRIKSK
jgi:uncharacterized protein